MRRLIAAAAVGAAALAASPGAPAATKLYSSGPLATAIPDPGSVDSTIRVPDAGPVSRLAVWVRLDHPRDADLTLSLVAPDGTAVTLSSHRGGAGRNYGAGSGCAASFALFEPEGTTPLAQAAAPFTDMDLRPEQPLSALYGKQARGAWRLRVADGAAGASGTIRCWKLELSRNVVETRAVRRGNVEASLSFREANDVYRDFRLRIVRAGRVAFDGRPRLFGYCASCANSGPVQERPLAIRNLDATREPEVLLDGFSGGAHCCAYTTVYRYVSSRRAYTATLRSWGNVGYRLVDPDRDGIPEFRTGDERFADRFVAHVASFDPIQVLRFDRGRFVDVTRRFPGLVAADARLLHAQYLRLRRAPYREVRGVLAAYVADEALLGRFATGWQLAQAAYERGDLGRAATKDGYPAGRAYLARLRAFLRSAGYAR